MILTGAVPDSDEETEPQDSVRLLSLCVSLPLPGVCVCVCVCRKKLVPLNKKVETRERRREVGVSCDSSHLT